MDIPGESQVHLAMREYELHQQAIQKFDGHRLQTRNWAVVVITAALAIAFSSAAPAIAVLAVAATGAFAVSEALHMALTLSVIQRTEELEPLIRPTATPEQLSEYQFGVSSAYRERTSLSKAAKLLFSRNRWHISFFYLALAVAAAVSAVLIEAGR